MTFTPSFPTPLHHDVARLVNDYFSFLANIDTVLVVNSCARGNAVPESDLDMAILAKPGTTAAEIKKIETAWHIYSSSQPIIIKYKESSLFAHLHVDIVDGNYTPGIQEIGGPLDLFEIEIGNQVCYSAPFENIGPYFRELQARWLPYYGDRLRLQRLKMAKDACVYDLEHIPFFLTRELYFHAFETLCKAFQEYLQALFIANKVYPISYYKWIREQITKWLNKPDLYPKLPPILSVSNIEGDEINNNVQMLRDLLIDLRDDH